MPTDCGHKSHNSPGLNPQNQEDFNIYLNLLRQFQQDFPTAPFNWTELGCCTLDAFTVLGVGEPPIGSQLYSIGRNITNSACSLASCRWALVAEVTTASETGNNAIMEPEAQFHKHKSHVQRRVNDQATCHDQNSQQAAMQAELQLLALTTTCLAKATSGHFLGHSGITLVPCLHDQVVELLRRRKMSAHCGLAKTLVERLMSTAKIRATAACVVDVHLRQQFPDLASILAQVVAIASTTVQTVLWKERCKLVGPIARRAPEELPARQPCPCAHCQEERVSRPQRSPMDSALVAAHYIYECRAGRLPLVGSLATSPVPGSFSEWRFHGTLPGLSTPQFGFDHSQQRFATRVGVQSGTHSVFVPSLSPTAVSALVV